MDDLYGDLPPAATGETTIDHSSQLFQGGLKTSFQQRVQSSGKSVSGGSLTATAAPQNQTETSQTKDQDDKSKSRSTGNSNLGAVTTSKLVPSSLLFKPRQTSVATPTPSSSSGPKAPAVTLQVSAPAFTNFNTSQKKVLNQQQPAESEEEKEELNLTASFEIINDPYDPAKPNDYLQFCEEREEKKRKARLIAENQRQFEEIEKQRLSLERQKKELAEKKDYQKLYELSNAGNNTTDNISDRGGNVSRGRGVVNLPAWMTQQLNNTAPATNTTLQRSIAEAPQQQPSAEVNNLEQKRKKMMVTKPSKILLLRNVVASLDEIDDNLSQEIKSECEKYGSVTSCTIHVVDRKRFPFLPIEEMIRVFVVFEKQESAIRALRELQGRYFGGKQLSANYFDEVKYSQRQLEPDEMD